MPPVYADRFNACVPTLIFAYEDTRFVPVSLSCAHDRPERITVGEEPLRVISEHCAECGALGPQAAGANPVGTTDVLWNLRYDQAH